MFVEPDSQLHREKPYYGLGRFCTFKKLIFGNVDFLKSTYRPLSRWLMFSASDFNAKTIEKYFETLKFALESSLEDGDDLPDIFFAALHNISEVIKNNISNLKQKSDNEIHSSLSCNNLIACSSGVLSLIHFIGVKTELFPLAVEINEDGYSYYKNDNNIYGAIAIGICKVIESFAMHPSRYECIRLILLEIYLFASSEPIKSIQNRMDILIKQKIENNLDKQLYPPVTASLIYTFGLSEPENSQIYIKEHLMIQLKKKFIRGYSCIPEVALDMLPNDTVFDPALKKLIRKPVPQWIRNKELQELNLEE